jgi:hypothetical protein
VNDDDIATARAYAEAYAAFDTEALRAVLAPDLQFRQVSCLKPGEQQRRRRPPVYLEKRQVRFRAWKGGHGSSGAVAV